MSFKLAGVIWNDDGTMANISEYEGVPIDADIYNKLKAFEIIKEKRVDIGLLIEYLKSYDIDSGRQEYNRWKNTRRLTQEEYETLKKVLL